MDFTLPEELRMLRETVARFVREELRPLEKEVIRREAERGLTDAHLIDPAAEEHLKKKAREIGIYGIDVPEEYGGQNLGLLAKAVVIEELKTSITPFVLPPDSPNLFMLKETCKGEQIEKYLKPVIEGDKTTAFAQTEPDAGSDPGGMMRTKAVKDGSDWVINGTKMWISNAAECDVLMVQAVTDPEKRQRGGEGSVGKAGVVALQVDRRERQRTGIGAKLGVDEQAVRVDEAKSLGHVSVQLLPDNSPSLQKHSWHLR